MRWLWTVKSGLPAATDGCSIARENHTAANNKNSAADKIQNPFKKRQPPSFFVAPHSQTLANRNHADHCQRRYPHHRLTNKPVPLVYPCPSSTARTHSIRKKNRLGHFCWWSVCAASLPLALFCGPPGRSLCGRAGVNTSRGRSSNATRVPPSFASLCATHSRPNLLKKPNPSSKPFPIPNASFNDHLQYLLRIQLDPRHQSTMSSYGTFSFDSSALNYVHKPLYSTPASFDAGESVSSISATFRSAKSKFGRRRRRRVTTSKYGKI